MCNTDRNLTERAQENQMKPAINPKDKGGDLAALPDDLTEKPVTRLSLKCLITILLVNVLLIVITSIYIVNLISADSTENPASREFSTPSTNPDLKANIAVV